MNIDNLNKLIAHLEAQPPERINMGHNVVRAHLCGTCGCIQGHAELLFGFRFLTDEKFEDLLGLTERQRQTLTMPDGWWSEKIGVNRYPAHRVIATLKRLRDTYLATGQVVVDWGPEPGEEPKTPWVAPQVAEVIVPALPAEITSLLRPSPVKTEA